MDEAFTLSPIVTVASLSEIADWLADPKGADWLVYACGPVPPRSAPVWAEARRLYETGRVVLRAALIDPAGRLWRWDMAKRADYPGGAAAAAFRAEPLDPDALALLEWIVDHAGAQDRAARLPSLAELGAALGLRAQSGKDRARYLLTVLEGRGRIRIKALPTGTRLAVLT